MEYFYLNLFELKQTKIYIFKKKFIINNGIYSDMYCNIEIIWSNILIKKIIVIFSILIFNFFSFDLNLKLNLYNFQYINKVIPNKFALTKYFNNLDKEKEVYFNITSINFSIETKNNIIINKSRILN